MFNIDKGRVIRNPSWWRRRTTLEKNLTIGSFLIFVVMVVSLGMLIYTKVQDNDKDELASLNGDNSLTGGRPQSRTVAIEYKKSTEFEGNLCLTAGCVASANSVLKNMDPSVNPCDDFYQFACGKFLKESIIPEDKMKINNLFSTSKDRLMDQLKIIVTEPISDKDTRPFKMAKQLYKLCMDKDRIEKLGLEPSKTILKRLGGWPVLEDSWDEESFTWRQIVYNFRKQGFSVSYFLHFSVQTNLKNSTQRIIKIDAAELEEEREYLVKGVQEKTVNAYYRYMVDIAVLFGADRYKATEELKKSLDFEIELAKISVPLEERRNASKLYNPMTIAELQRKFPSIPWLEYINTILAPTNEVRDNEVLIVNTPSYITNLERLLSTIPKRIQANYVMWRAVASMVSYLSENVRERQLEYGTELSGMTEREPRWKECVDTAAGSFNLVIGSMYVKRYFKDTAKTIFDMVEGIRQEMYKILSSADWLDENTRKTSLDKARSMVNHIDYPAELLEDRKIEDFYAKLEIPSDDYLGSLLSVKKFHTDYNFLKLHEPVNKTDWITHSRPTLVNAYYSHLENSIEIEAGILQGAFFSNDRPHYMNYGAIGFVIGHEITHGFSNVGIYFDKDGNLGYWWDLQTIGRFMEKANCIVDQYGNYTAEEVGLKLNGIKTLQENIADNSGVREAYLAYQSWVKKNGPEPRLPGLQDYSPQQMFWLSAANMWCSKHRPEFLDRFINIKDHSPEQFRVIGSFSNLDEFAWDFQCPKGSKMNPSKKCSIW